MTSPRFEDLIKNPKATLEELDAAWKMYNIQDEKKTITEKIQENLLVTIENRNRNGMDWLLHKWQMQKSSPNDKLDLKEAKRKAKSLGFVEIVKALSYAKTMLDLSYIKMIDKSHIPFFRDQTFPAEKSNETSAIGLRK